MAPNLSIYYSICITVFVLYLLVYVLVFIVVSVFMLYSNKLSIIYLCIFSRLLLPLLLGDSINLWLII